MKRISIYYLILAMMSSYILNNQHYAFIRNDQQRIGIENEVEDIWAMELAPEQVINTDLEQLKRNDDREKKYRDRQVKEEQVEKQLQDIKEDREGQIEEERKKDREEQVEEEREEDREGQVEEERKEYREEQVEEEREEDREEQVEGERKKDREGQVEEERKEDREGQVEEREEDIEEQGDEESKENKNKKIEEKENQEEHIGKQVEQEKEKRREIDTNNQQTTASSYDIERKEPKNEPNSEEDKKQQESNRLDEPILQKDQLIIGDIHFEEGTLDLNGKTLEVMGDFYHNGGTITIHNGKLIIHGSYYVNHEKKKTGNNSILVLQNSEDYLSVGGDIITYASDWLKECIRGKIMLGGHFIGISKSREVGYQTSLGSEWELILVGEDTQKIDVASMCVSLPIIKIEGKENRKIEFLMLKDNTKQSRKHHIISLENQVECQVVLPESLKIENINAMKPLIINGNCETKQLNVFGNKIIINGDLKIGYGINFNKGQVVVNGSLTLLTANRIEMQYSEDQLQIRDDFLMRNCKEIILQKGVLIIGGNIIQSHALGVFMTEEHLCLIFLGSQNEKERLRGDQITLKCVEYSEVKWGEAKV